MLTFENIVTPSPEQFKIVIHGMRNAFKSWEKGDSIICDDVCMEKEACYNDCPYVDHWEDEPPYSIPICGIENEEEKVFVLGENDKQRLLDLCKAGDPSHRKVLRQLPVIMDIKAPLYWHKQMDQYKVGTVTNSTSQMHTLLKRPFKVSDFSFDRLYDSESGQVVGDYIIDVLNILREAYFDPENKERKDMIWHQILELIPQSFNYTRTWSGNYETLVNIIKQRKGHPLVEWKQFIDLALENVPYLREIVEAVND